MTAASQLIEELRTVKSLPTLIGFLRDALVWPVECSELDELTFDWDADQLSIGVSQTRTLAGGVVRQLRPLAPGQPWGIFIVEFSDDSFHRGALREILRGLVANRRRDPSLPAWQHDNLLFICATRDYEEIAFAHYRGQKAQKARLSTFRWRQGSPYVRTLCEFNLPALHWPDDCAAADAWLKQWSAAFDKEPLTKEFFKRFDKALEAVQADLGKYHDYSSAESYSRAQLLLERMVFMYFLQNRGWLNRQRHYLLDNFSDHRERPDDFSYYEEFLLKLFWTLASAPGSFDRFPGVPYLNGGLFDDDEFNPQPVYRKINPPLRVRNDTFAFIFEHLLEAFNFTVREDTPLNQDVAVDPEMLGKVFESIVLHAESQADYNAPDKRKATGSYYTPRIVVHFICREALRQYLRGHLSPDWDNKLKALFAVDAADGLEPEEIATLKSALSPADGQRLLELLKPLKMCDPAVGSGAFPVGLLHELVNLRRIAVTVAKGFIDPARKEGSNWIHEMKADIVENCLYGVDIQQQAIEICRLRLWLSLIVDYDIGLDPFEADRTQFHHAISGISQLPNLEMNFRRGDSLLDLICDVPVRVEQRRMFEDDYEKIHKLGRALHKAKKSERKRNLRVEILQRRLDLTERVLTQELNQLQMKDSALAGNWFGENKSDAEARRRIAAEVERLKLALSKIRSDRQALSRIAARRMDARFYPELRKLEGADFDAPFNFAWRLDFADIFSFSAGGPCSVMAADATERVPPKASGGFDLILGNPPFVTARNPKKRELYRARWKQVCSGNYLLVCPFFNLSFELLRPGGQLGFIVSNAFAKREFGKPLVEKFFPTVDIQKVIDCSGLLFPGHGTPTCIVFGRNTQPDEDTPIRITATLPGGGDLRTQPEESPLWHAIAAQHDNPGYTDDRISVADRPRMDMGRWPWNLEPNIQDMHSSLRLLSEYILQDYVDEPVGHVAITRTDDVFLLPSHLARRLAIEIKHLRFIGTGETVRNWSRLEYELIVFPYNDDLSPLLPKQSPRCVEYLKPYRPTLENVVMHGSVRKKETQVHWFEYSRLARGKFRAPSSLIIPEIATHNHAMAEKSGAIFHQTVPVIKLSPKSTFEEHHFLSGLLNSSAALFWLKQVCFNKGAGGNEERDRFVFAGGKVQQLPVPDAVADALHGKANSLATRLQRLSQACWERGNQMPALAMKKLFEQSGEAYHDWNSALPGYVAPNPRLGQPFQTADDLRSRFDDVCKIRENLRGEMIALQEEMDWLVYEAYGLLSAGGPCSVMAADATERVPPLLREERPFVLWAQAEGDFEKAASLIPSDWPQERKDLWGARLETIRDNEHIRRIEAPVYKRRWDEQWKVGNRWQCGQTAYDAELTDAFDWWLSEKAEWWLEKKKGGGPVDLPEWTNALGSDARVKSAWHVASEALCRRGRRADFDRYFTALVREQSVPANIPFAVPWDKLPKNLKIPANTKRIRGKLNVPRERFRITDSGQYIWAGVRPDSG